MMDVEQAANQPDSEFEKNKAKENSNAAGNHGDGHINGMTNGIDRRKEHKSDRKEKERSHKSDHRDKDRSREKSRSHKSEHRDKEKDRHKLSSSSTSSSSVSKDKDKNLNNNSSSSSSKDKDKKSSSSSSNNNNSSSNSNSNNSSSPSKDKERDHKSSSVTKEKEKDRDKNRDHHHHHKSTSKDKEKYHSSSKDKDRDSSKSKDKHRSESRSKDKSLSKEKDRKHSSSSKDKEKSHSLSDKDKNRSEKDRHRHEKDKHDREKEKNNKIKKEIDDCNIKNESNHHFEENGYINLENNQKNYMSNNSKPLHTIKNEIISQPQSNDYDNHQVNNNDDEDSNEPSLYIKEEDDNDEKPKQHYQEENNSLDSTGNDTRLSDLHNTTIKTEEESDEDVPLSVRASTSTTTKRKFDNSDDNDDDVPLSARKKPKKEKITKKKKKRKQSDDEDEEEEDQPVKKKKATKTSTAAAAAAAAANTPSPRKKKKEEEEAEVWKWWEEDKKSDGTKWTFLEHKGPVFAPPYERIPDSVKFYYNGKEMRLSEEAEEVATFYARMLDHDYTTKQIFNDNFFKDWREVMTESERSKIVDLKKCNFTEMNKYFIEKSEERKAMSKEEKKVLKEQNEEIIKEYGFCTIDGHKEKIGNFKIEPPGLFRGRGEHPKMGKLKKRVLPEDVLINCSKNSVIPKPPPGHKWKEIRHDSSVTWLASWTENVQNQVKYVMLNPSSKLKGEKDWQKYETARKLAKSIDKIRNEYRDDWKSKEMRIRQRAVALYFIDKLALRAGNEKDEDQADTVGCCSLRVEHISLHEHKDNKDYVVVFDFLGKDSIRYYNEVPVEKRVFKNLQLFKENKSDGDDLFDRLNTTVLNKHLNELMEGLTAKVFRTYNASWTLQQQLDKLTNPNDTVAEKILSYNRANRAVAILCNHQRSVPKTHAKSMENLKTKIDTKKQTIQECEEQVKDFKKEAKRGGVKSKENYEKAKKKLDKLKEQLMKLELQATDREENKEIALGTSKLNYLDPRISVAWCKKHDVPIEKIYNKTQRDKFRWAIDMAGPDYVF